MQCTWRVCALCSWPLNEPVKVHSQYQINPAAGYATKERRRPGRKIKRRRCGKGEEKKKCMRKSGGCVYSYFAYLATSSSKATACLQHIWE